MSLKSDELAKRYFIQGSNFLFSANTLESLHSRILDQRKVERISTEDGSLPAMVPSVVCRSLAIELFIKALIVVSGNKPKKLHNHSKLFSQIDLPVQRKIRSHYNSYVKTLDKKYVRSVIDHEPTLSDKQFFAFDRVLKKGSMAFENWRYSFESDEVIHDSRTVFIQDSIIAIAVCEQPDWGTILTNCGNAPDFHKLVYTHS